MAAQPSKKDSDRKNLLGIEADKNTNFPEWYTQVITRAELIDYYDISGCYILRPWSYSIWEQIQQFFDGEIKKLGVQNAYFPLFVSEKALNKEANHVEGFAPEVAWVTKSGKSDLKEPIAVRPTSETIMYPAYSKWIRSHRDLPLKLNQWANVVRWEFKSPTPFLRSREFLWQEGHTAFATLEEASKEVLDILDLYARVYEELLAVPVIKGKKTELEKFPGGYYTTTVEAFVPFSGRGIQAATSHCLGQNFAKMFDIAFENDQREKQYAWQNSWGLTTRSIGIMIMMHGDERGLVLPPRIAPIQVACVTIPYKEKDNVGLSKRAKELVDELTAAGIRTTLDDRDNYTPGFKFNHWELKGVPLRIEFGHKDWENGVCVVARRDIAKAKETVQQSNLVSRVRELLEEVQKSLFEKARNGRDDRLARPTEWKDFMIALDSSKMALTPFCQENECEENIKAKTKEAAVSAAVAATNNNNNAAAQEGAEPAAEEKKEEEFEPISVAAKSLCIPFEQPEIADHKCICCGKPAKVWCLFGRSY